MVLSYTHCDIVLYMYMYMHIPSSLLTKGLVLKGSISSMCSPVPMNVMGLFVAATLSGWREGEREGGKK